MTGVLSAVVFFFAIFLLIAFRRKKNLNLLLEQRIYGRTRELESSRDELLRAIGEKDRGAARLANSISGSITTIEGLCATASKQTTDSSMHFYLEKIVRTAIGIGSRVRQTPESNVLNKNHVD